MRSLSAPANRVMVILAAVALAYALRLPWYAPAGVDANPTDGPVERFAWQLARIFQDVPGSLTGDGTTPGGTTLLVGAAGAVAVVALVLLARPSRLLGDVLRLLAPVPAVVVGVAAFDRPAGFAVHHGLLIGALAALVLASAAWRGGEVRPRPETALRF